MKVNRSVLVPYRPEQMFDVVNDVASYPSFLPGCLDAIVHEATSSRMRATLTLRRAGISVRLTTENTLSRPTRIVVALVEGPFKRLTGEWLFEPLGDDGCRVTLELDFAASGITAFAVESMFSRVADQMVDAFSVRAEQRFPG